MRPKRELLRASRLCLDAPGGRALVRGLSLNLDVGDRVALVGRNGVGKSSLLEVLAASSSPTRGDVTCHGTRLLVPQDFEGEEGFEASGSPGERRRRHLEDARLARPELLLLDEPTRDLDRESTDWLMGWLTTWRGALLVASHDRRLLRTFGAFFVIAETGCRAFDGGYDELMADLERRREQDERRYVRNLGRLLDKERRDEKVRHRRQRKKNLGRLHELGRCTSRAALGKKRSYAQQSQGKRAVLQRQRLGAAREWVKATRRALAVQLPLELAVPRLPAALGRPIVELEAVSARAHDQPLFGGISLRVERERLAIAGPNGAGKTTLIETLLGHREPTRGAAKREPDRLGYIAQNGQNWRSDRSLLDHLMVSGATSYTDAARVLRAHRFPFALAERALASLSPGERSRAALIALFARRPSIELLVLDEPTQHLDFVGRAALEAALAAWPGGLVVVSHDELFLETIGVERRLVLGGSGRDAVVS